MGKACAYRPSAKAASARNSLAVTLPCPPRPWIRISLSNPITPPRFYTDRSRPAPNGRPLSPLALRERLLRLQVAHNPVELPSGGVQKQYRRGPVDAELLAKAFLRPIGDSPGHQVLVDEGFHAFRWIRHGIHGLATLSFGVEEVGQDVALVLAGLSKGLVFFGEPFDIC